jgi:two-component system, OmpR family, response regulator
MPTRDFHSILYVDDDPDIRCIVVAALSLVAGLTVRTADSGERAIDLAYELRPDLVLMDVMMPGVDGPSTLKRMRESVLLANIPVIFITAKVQRAEIARLRQLGAIGVIVKPFDPVTLCDEVFALWKNHDAACRRPIPHGGRSHLREQAHSLTASFLRRARTDVARLSEMIQRAREGDRSAFRQIENVAHAMHGAGAMIGFPEVGRIAGSLEHLAVTLMAGTDTHGSACGAMVMQQLLECSRQLAREVNTAGQTAPDSAAMFQGIGAGR